MRKAVIAAVLLLLFALPQGVTEPLISAAVQVKASRSVYDSMIRAGEDVDISVDIQGFAPAACQWYREDEAIDGANGTLLHISSAKTQDTGIYRMDAMDENGKVRVSADVSLRVVDSTIPKMGDARLPAPVIGAAMAAAAAVCLLSGKKRAFR